jgi:hypothetical protein
VAIVAGSKVSTKLTILKSLSANVDQLIVGGGIANTFMLGTGLSDALRRDPPPIGTQITFRDRELTDQGRPRFASFQRLRDL